MALIMLLTFIPVSAKDHSKEWCDENCHWELTDVVVLDMPEAEGYTFDESSVAFVGDHGNHFEGKAVGVQKEYRSGEYFKFRFFSIFEGMNNEIFKPNAFVGSGAERDYLNSPPDSFYKNEYKEIYRESTEKSLADQNTKHRTRSGEEGDVGILNPEDKIYEYSDKEINGKPCQWNNIKQKYTCSGHMPKIEKVGEKAALLSASGRGSRHPTLSPTNWKGKPALSIIRI